VACGNSGSSQTGGTTADTGDTANTGSADTSAASDYAVAMITDYGDITDQSFNQTTYEACKEYCEANGIEFTYFKPAGDADTERVAMIEKAVDEGYNIIVMPGYAFAAAIVEAAPQYPDVKFVALDVAEGDYLAAVGGDDYYANPGNYSLDKDCDLSNVYTMIYQEELAGYMAGYATVKMGYTKLGFCGGMAVPAVIRYGYGFLQGADAAAAELGVDVSVKYTYANQFYGDADVTAAMDSMYSAGTEVVFACGGGVFTSVAEAAAKVGGKVVGVDVDQAATIDAYGEGMTITSAMKGLAASTKDALKQIVEEDNWSSLAGTIANLGLVSATDPDANFVGIPTGDGTQWSDNFTQDDYAQLVADMYNGVITVSNDTTLAVGDVVSNITVEDLGNIK
jgi:basic membrane protein A